MVSVRYPQLPGTVDAGSIMDAFDSGFDRSRKERDDRLANEAFGQYVGTLYGKPKTLASLGSVVAPQQATTGSQGAIARTPLPQPMDPATARVDAAFAAQGQGRNSLSGNQIAGRFLKSVREGGVTNPYALAAIAATGKRESGFSPKNASGTWSDPSQSGQAGTAGGIMSWRGDRLSALQQFAQQRGDDPNAPSPETQGAFLVAEDPSLIQKLQAAQSPQEAQQLMNNAWKFAGYNQQGGETAARMALAQEYAPQFGGNGPSQAALESMAVGQTMPAGGTQVADASGGMPAIPTADPSSLLPPREVMLGLFKSPATRQFAMSLAQSAMELRANAADPLARVQYQTAIAQLAKAQKGETDKFGNSVIWGQDEAGNWVALQPSSGGGLTQAQIPQGIKLSPPGASNLNLGTSIAVRDRNGNVTNQVSVDNFGKASDTAAGKDEGEARATYASMQSKMPGLETVVSDLDRLAEQATYTTGGRVYDTVRKEMGAEPRAAAVARTQYISTVSNQILPLLRDTFGAQFTAREGDTLMATLGDPNVTPAEKQAVLKTFIEQKRRDVEALANRTGQPEGKKRLRFNPETGELE